LRARRAFRVGGQGPKFRWKKNRGGLKRTIDQAVAIAREYGIEVPFRIHPDVLISDEAIVAVFQHEMHELSLLREMLMRSRTGSMDGTDYGLQTAEGRPANFHERAWDEADKIILRMRRRGR